MASERLAVHKAKEHLPRVIESYAQLSAVMKEHPGEYYRCFPVPLAAYWTGPLKRVFARSLPRGITLKLPLVGDGTYSKQDIENLSIR